MVHFGACPVEIGRRVLASVQTWGRKRDRLFEPNSIRSALTPSPRNEAFMSLLMVIDDDRSVLYMIERTFQGSDVKVLPARTVREGLQQFDQKPDVVILDIMLPEGSGLEAVQQIQALDPKLPVIFITGHGTTETAIEAMKLGAFDYLLKPLDLAQLRELVERAVGDQPADARPRPMRRRTEPATGRGRRPDVARRPLPGDAGGVQGDRPGRRRRTSPC